MSDAADVLRRWPAVARGRDPRRATDGPSKIEAERLNFYYGDKQALADISVKIHPNVVTAFIGPSGCGKSTFLRTLNRMNDIIPGTRVEGKVLIDGADIYGPGVDVVALRRRVGMVFQKSNPFPKSIFENVAYGLRINGMAGSRAELAARVEESLKQAALWDEVKDRLHESALALSGGQQQRLCIARALAVRPDILLMDEPASALDPIATQRIEELVYDLKKHYTIVIVTHNMQQAARVSDYTAFFWLGQLVEYDRTEKMFTTPAEKLTEDYVTGRFGKAWNAPFGTSRRSSRRCRRGCSRWAAWPRSACARPCRGSSTRDVALIDKVLRGDEPINELHIEVDNRCFTLLALYQPMATDLRAIVAAVKINTDLERVGDLAVNIAEAAHRYATHPPVKKLIDIPQMGDIAQTMLRDALDSFVRRDTRWRTQVLNEDDQLDALKTQVFRELLTYMLRRPDDGRAGARPDPDLPPSRADRRPRHEHRRGRDLHGVGARRPAPSAATPPDLDSNRSGIRQLDQPSPIPPDHEI